MIRRNWKQTKGVGGSTKKNGFAGIDKKGEERELGLEIVDGAAVEEVERIRFATEKDELGFG